MCKYITNHSKTSARVQTKHALEIIKAMIAATAQYTGLNNMQVLICSGSELVNKLTKQASFAKMADGILSSCTNIAANTPCKDPAQDSGKTVLLNVLGHRLVHHVIGKPDKIRGAFTSLQDIGHAFCQDLATISGQKVGSPFASVAGAAAPQGAAQAGFVRGRWLRCVGACWRCQRFGFEVEGCIVHRDHQAGRWWQRGTSCTYGCFVGEGEDACKPGPHE